MRRSFSTVTVAAISALAATACAGCAGADGSQDAPTGSVTSPLTSGTSAISGTVFQDLNRNGVQDAGEAPFSGLMIALFDATGANVAVATTDVAGNYSFAGIADGNYRVAFDMRSWWNVRNAWVATTPTGSPPSASLTLATSAIVPFGLRPIVRSTDMTKPISTYTAPNGLVINVYDDVVAPSTIYDVVMAGRVGPEAALTTILFDYASSSSTSTSVAGSPGSYSNYRANVYVDYVSWLDSADVPISHEYGHAWSLYNAYVVQQDSTMASYLAARGLTGNALVNSSYMWSTREMIAEDYRQLLGAPDARSAPQANSQIPPASQVPGLADFLANVFTVPPAGTSSGGNSGGSSTTTSPPPLAITGPTVSPSPVTNGGTVTWSLSAPATVSVGIRNASGAVVRTLVSSTSETAGSQSATWDRKDARGHRVASGSYVARVDAIDSTGTITTSNVTFQVK
jgi:hypothetical protein